MTVAVIKLANGSPYVVHNKAKNSDGVEFTLSNYVKDSDGNDFEIFDNSIETVTVTGGIFDVADSRVFFA